MKVTEFQELVKDAPKFASMERGELATYAYAMYAAGAKVDAENAKLRVLLNETLARLSAANEAAGGGFIDAQYCELLESYGIEVGK